MQIANSLKEQIIAGVASYVENKKISNNEIARLTKINPAYISNMLRNKFTVEVNGKDVPISDKWFFSLAEWSGIEITKSYWETVNTMQFLQILPILEQAKASSRASVIIAPTGSGKSYAVDKFCRKNPQSVVKITVNSLHHLPDILKDLVAKLGIQFASLSLAGMLNDVIEQCRKNKRNGHNPMIIIDEAENMTLPLLKLLKGLYDGINGYASVVLIGTDQLTRKLEKLRLHDKEGIPQLYRRLKAGIRFIHAENEFNKFFDRLGVEDKGLRKLLTNICDNYGELNDYLEAALREADNQEQPLTEDLFRIIYNMPK
jgi:DNA transposition AAA+ family ATPase